MSRKKESEILKNKAHIQKNRKRQLEKMQLKKLIQSSNL
jgi:hypothetical protein